MTSLFHAFKGRLFYVKQLCDRGVRGRTHSKLYLHYHTYTSTHPSKHTVHHPSFQNKSTDSQNINDNDGPFWLVSASYTVWFNSFWSYSKPILHSWASIINLSRWFDNIKCAAHFQCVHSTIIISATDFYNNYSTLSVLRSFYKQSFDKFTFLPWFMNDQSIKPSTRQLTSIGFKNIYTVYTSFPSGLWQE